MDTKVYLRHATSQFYLSGWLSWTRDPKQAKNFENTDTALHRVRVLHLSHVELVILDGGSEKVLPVIEPGSAKHP
jgi:hypothetical protein